MHVIGIVFPSRKKLLEALPKLLDAFPGKFRHDLNRIDQMDQEIYLINAKTLEEAWRYGAIDFSSLFFQPNRDAFPADVRTYLMSRIRIRTP
jgi:hypothetical protein